MLVYDTWWAKITPFSNNFFWFPQFKGDKLYTKIMQKKMSLCLFNSLRLLSLFFLSLDRKNNTLFLECTRAHRSSLIPLVTWVLSTIQDAQCKTEESLYHKNPMSPFISSVIDHKCQKVVQKKGGGSTRCQPSVSLIFFPQFDLSYDLLLSNCS